jgi:RNA polymerase sigma factor (sigma-70 family)
LPDALTKKEITREKFSRFLEWLSPDLDRAVEEYERIRFRLSTFFAQRRCVFADELVDETINRVILKSGEEEIASKTAYFYGVAKNVYRESLRRERPRVDLDEVQIVAETKEEPTFSHECLDKCLRELSPDSQTLLLDYFSEAKTAKVELHQRISKSLNVTQTALRMRVLRLKQKLKSCVVECMS